MFPNLNMLQFFFLTSGFVPTILCIRECGRLRCVRRSGFTVHTKRSDFPGEPWRDLGEEVRWALRLRGHRFEVRRNQDENRADTGEYPDLHFHTS